jgi:lipopolysaccharide O-acetyltransferase
MRLAYSLCVTKLICREARLIRAPAYLRNRALIVFGKNFTSGVGIRVEAFGDDHQSPIIIIGSDVQVNDYVHIAATTSVRIGNNVLIASKVFISDHNHGRYSDPSPQDSPMTPPAKRPLVAAPVVIEDNVWLGEFVAVLPGVTIGKGSIIGAASVVTRDIPPDSIAVGAPARVIKRYVHEGKTWVAV